LLSCRQSIILLGTDVLSHPGGRDPERGGRTRYGLEKNYANSPALITLEIRLRRVFVLRFRTRIADPSIFHDCTPNEKACSERRSVDASCDFQ
jgi:hypothetical protein